MIEGEPHHVDTSAADCRNSFQQGINRLRFTVCITTCKAVTALPPFTPPARPAPVDVSSPFTASEVQLLPVQLLAASSAFLVSFLRKG